MPKRKLIISQNLNELLLQKFKNRFPTGLLSLENLRNYGETI
ncbi:hypothetical protein QFZ73_004945 [Peribacillus sp. V2I11]|nr:hypothetical protein [Peribacillus sp. V2I11]